MSDKSRIICAALFLAYAVLTFVGALNHELWFDEGQAWTIARDNTVGGIFHQLSYEGHPPLWYLILHVFSRLGFGCTVIPLISWFISAAAAAVILFKAPFGIPLKAAVVFSGGFLFFNTVMSRVYCLINLAAALIAWLYPKRKKHPILFGLLIALLANTHVCVSGFIGIMGIFMLADFFRGAGKNSAKQNVSEIVGLAVSAAGVLTMSLPLLNSMSLNAVASEKTVSAGAAARAFLGSLSSVSQAMIGYGSDSPIPYIVSGFMAAAIAAAAILMRHKTRPFLMLIFFWLFYTLSTELFWFTIPNRAYIFMLMFFVILWIAEYEPVNGAGKIWSKADNIKADSEAVKKFFAFLKSSDMNFRHSCAIMLTAVLLCTVPAGAYYLFRDYAEPFCLSKEAAAYIEENIPKGSVFLTDEEVAPQIAAYLPEYRFYSLNFGEFYTYYSHAQPPESVSADLVREDLSGFETVYYLRLSGDADAVQSVGNVIYSVRGGIPFGANFLYAEISETDLESEVKKLHAA